MEFLWRLALGAWCFFPAATFAQQSTLSTGVTGHYTSDISTLAEAQSDVLQQAREMLEKSEKPTEHQALAAAIKEMERAKAALSEAKNSPDKLPAAITAEESAYQALLKLIPREKRISRSRRSSRGRRRRR